MEGQGEVRTVEEEALFSRAYPDVVERYRADKALAEEDKTKSKSPADPNYYGGSLVYFNMVEM